MPDINLAKDFDTQLKNDYLALGQPIREDSFANFCENKAVELYDITNYTFVSSMLFAFSPLHTEKYMKSEIAILLRL